MRRVPLLSGSRIVVVPVDGDDLILRPPPPPTRVADVGAAVRDALRFPLSGPSLSALTTRGGRATIVVEPPALPFPGAPLDPRREALAATIAELEETGISDERQTIVVAGGLGRRLGQRDLERLLPPPQARAFRGRVLVHDVEDPGLVRMSVDVGVNPALLETDVVVVVSAAETILHGGPGALLSACDAQTIRRCAAVESFLQAAGAPEWARALAVEAEIGSRVASTGISLVLDHPRLTGRFRGYPHEALSLEHVIRSPLRRLFSRASRAALRRRLLRDQGRRIATTAAYGGTPSVAHAEALLRGVELRGTRVTEPFDALVVGVPWVGPHLPREPLNP